MGEAENKEEQRSPLRTWQDEGITHVYCPECYVIETMDTYRHFKHEQGCVNDD